MTKRKRVGLATVWVHVRVLGRLSGKRMLGPQGRGAESQVPGRGKGTSGHHQGPRRLFHTHVEGWLAPLRRRVRNRLR